jgi:hypothetical protein
VQFAAEVTQQIPDKGQHLIQYFGPHSNKERGMREKRDLVVHDVFSDGEVTGDGAFIKKLEMSWAA